MMLFVLLAMLASQIFVLTTNANSLFIPNNVCLDVSSGRVYISRDVVFDENVFSFAAPHPNTGTRLKQDILLLPSSTPLQEDDANFVDHIVPIVSSTNVLLGGEVAKENRGEMVIRTL
jgi:hypothetical protein